MMPDMDGPAHRAPTLDTGAKIVVLCGGSVATLALVAIASVLPQIDQALARSPAEHLLVKQLIGGVSLAMVFGAATVGFLIDRFRLRPVLIGAAILYAVAGTAGLYLRDLPSLLLSRLVVGFTAAAIQVACITLINVRLSGLDRARWMGRHIAVAMLTAIVVHPIAGLLGDAGWRGPFVLYALGLIMVPAALLQHPSPVPSSPIHRDGTSLLSWFPLRYILLAFAIGTLALMPSVQVPYLLRANQLVQPSAIAVVLTADSLAGAVLALLYGRARTRFSASALFAISFAIVAIGLAVAASGRSIGVVIAGLLIYGAGIGWFVPNMMTSLAAQVAPAHQARAAGIIKSAHFLAAPVSVALVEPVARSYGPAGTLLAAAGLAFACLIVVGLRHGRRLRRPASSTPTGSSAPAAAPSGRSRGCQ